MRMTSWTKTDRLSLVRSIIADGWENDGCASRLHQHVRVQDKRARFGECSRLIEEDILRRSRTRERERQGRTVNAARRISTFRCFEEQDLVHAFDGQRERNDRVFGRDLMLIAQLTEDHVACFTEEQFFVGVRAAFRNHVTS